MNLYQSLYDIAVMLQAGEHPQQLPQKLMERIVATTDAHKGFIVVEEDGDFVEKHQICFDAAGISDEKRHFSRSLVREAIRTRETILTLDFSEDPRFSNAVSLADIGGASILVAPLLHESKVFAVIYQERHASEGPFSDEARLFMREFVNLAGPALFKGLKYNEASSRTREMDFSGVVTRHPSMQDLLDTVSLVAGSDATTLVRGETGTGKEVIARAIYQNSDRADKPFVTLHCGALPESLFESELFGHKRGAFTGANRDRVGRIAQADGGTLFIDEVAEIPPAAQAKLLRFFQFNEFQRIGSDKVERVDVRIIAATHQNLEQMVADGTFRQDLYYRLNVVELEIPPLRERRSDIPLLAEHFLKKYWKGHGQPGFDDEARLAMASYPYPGNVRELAHVIERICVLARDPVVSLKLLPRPIQEHYSEQRGEMSLAGADLNFVDFTNDELKAARDDVTRKAVEAVERNFISGLLKTCQGNVALAARKAGMHRTYLYKLLSRYKTSF